MEVTTHRARVVWEGGREDLCAHRVELGEQVLPASSMAAIGGDGSKADPEDMLVAALSSCHMLWFCADRFVDAILGPWVEVGLP